MWLDEQRGSAIAASALAAIVRAAQAAASRPLAYAWVGAFQPSLAGAPSEYRRVLAWGRRIHLFYRYTQERDHVQILHIRGARQQPLSQQRLNPSAASRGMKPRSKPGNAASGRQLAV